MNTYLKRNSAKRKAGMRPWRHTSWVTILLVIFLLAGCYPRVHHGISLPPPREPARVAKAPMTQVYFYPKAGQTTEQQSRDHYDCYNWAVKQTGFDPGQSPMQSEERVRIVPMPPPGHDTAAFAIAGAVLGALIGGPRHVVGGAIVGASGGLIVGATSDAARMESARQQSEAYSSKDKAREAQIEEKAFGFRRAMSACLEGRNYSVR